MDVLCFYGSIIAAIFLYYNTASLLKGIKNREDIEAETMIGGILFGFIIFSILFLCTK